MNKQQQIDIAELAQRFSLTNELKNSCVLVTGATGLLGQILVRLCIALNHRNHANIQIVALARNEEKAKQLFEGEEVAICLHSFDSPIEWEGDVDYVFHCASPTASKFFVTSPVETINMVSEATNCILRFCKEKGVRSCVYLSSLEVYGEILDDTIALTENRGGPLDSLSPRSSYSLGKRMMECLCASYAKEYGVPVRIARLAQTFGAGVEVTDQRVFAHFAHSILKGQDIVLLSSGELSRCYCYTTDAIEALFYILLRGEVGKAYNVANERTYISVRDMAQKVIDDFAPQLCVRFEQPKEDCGFSPVTKLRLDTTALRLLGWRPHLDLHEMYARFLESCK
ncbi:MAG: NAD(P)-dependent oxidoreductase [Bacteroidaceae bacterium]